MSCVLLMCGVRVVVCRLVVVCCMIIVVCVVCCLVFVVCWCSRFVVRRAVIASYCAFVLFVVGWLSLIAVC